MKKRMRPFVGVGLLFFRHFLNAPFERDWRSGGADAAYQDGETPPGIYLQHSFDRS